MNIKGGNTAGASKQLFRPGRLASANTFVNRFWVDELDEKWWIPLNKNANTQCNLYGESDGGGGVGTATGIRWKDGVNVTYQMAISNLSLNFIKEPTTAQLLQITVEDVAPKNRNLSSATYPRQAARNTREVVLLEFVYTPPKYGAPSTHASGTRANVEASDNLHFQSININLNDRLQTETLRLQCLRVVAPGGAAGNGRSSSSDSIKSELASFRAEIIVCNEA